MRIIRDFDEAKAVLERSTFEIGESRKQEVERIITEVRERGDAALLDFTRRLDGVELESLAASREEVEKAYREVGEELLSALHLAAQRVRSFHLAQMRHSLKEFRQGGLGQILRPLDRVGIYAPGGTACYPSTVLMTAIPAKVAGVKEIVLATPPGKGGVIPSPTLVAADIAQVDRVFKVGGAQAIAALAFGTQSVPRVDKICGPGNIFVVLAKKMVFGVVDIDGLAGPSETVILADDSASPSLCAADLLAQAEHDVLSSSILITTSSKLAEEVDKEVERQLRGLERRTIASQSWQQRGRIIVVKDMEQAIELVNLHAPEHLSLMVRHAPSYVDRIRNVGAIFIGESSPETLGDYVAGPSHVLPTGGSARFSSPLGVYDFLKSTSVIALSDSELEALGPAAATIARAEGLTAHARAVEQRLEQEGKR